jgi:hypothetical protein
MERLAERIADRRVRCMSIDEMTVELPGRALVHYESRIYLEITGTCSTQRRSPCG